LEHVVVLAAAGGEDVERCSLCNGLCHTAVPRYRLLQPTSTTSTSTTGTAVSC
jgi:hypothetical protein